MDHNPATIEAKFKKLWVEEGIYKVDIDHNKPKYYVLDMFPYPSGAGLHVGHPLGYIASDIYSRFKRMSGFNVLHPMGFDAFGLPAEDYAIQTNIHPDISTKENMKRYRKQLGNLGFSFDWSREVVTCEPKYYKWTQWIFTLLFDHYYDLTDKKARSIKELINIFSKTGNKGINAASDISIQFNADEWNTYSPKQRDEILMSYRLAYRKVGYVNWCEALGTVLANDQVKDGVAERGGHPVIQRAMTQWYLRITAYGDRLLYDLDDIDWSDSLKTIQRNWIGRSEGASIFFEVANSTERIEVFTTRPDTIFGATYMVLAPEHDLVASLTTEAQQQAVSDYISYVNSKSEVERMAEKQVTGEFIGAYAINPFTNEQIPIWIGEYVLKDYGTGAIMAVPSDDDRDNVFANKFGLKIIDVVDKSKYPDATLHDKLGVIKNSGFLNGMEVPEAITAACAKVEELGIGKAMINYKMRDANFSRQRYWGEPFPIEYDLDDIPHILPIEKLPLVLPETTDFKPKADGGTPLSRIKEWIEPEPGRSREQDVMPAVAGSSWYYLRYMDPNNDEVFASKESLDYWQDVDLYVGGSEHAVAHLMYARFWHKFLYDLGYLPTGEPFKKLVNQGMIQGVIEFIYLKKDRDVNAEFVDASLVDDEDAFIKIPVHIDFVQEYGFDHSYLDIAGIRKFLEWRPEYGNAIFTQSDGLKWQFGEDNADIDLESFRITTSSAVGKMSKSLFNVINPDDVISEYGADCFRMYEMFLGPIHQAKPWDTKGIDGVSKFLRKFWSLFHNDEGQLDVSEDAPSPEALKALHTAIRKVTQDIESMSFNTAISTFMICVNDLRKLNSNNKSILVDLVKLMAPFAPYTCDELWRFLGNKTSVHLEQFPEYNESYLIETTVSYPLCVNGKKRSTIEIDAQASKDEVIKMVMEDQSMSRWLDGKSIKKVIFVPNRMVNIVI